MLWYNTFKNQFVFERFLNIEGTKQSRYYDYLIFYSLIVMNSEKKNENVNYKIILNERSH